MAIQLIHLIMSLYSSLFVVCYGSYAGFSKAMHASILKQPF